MISSISDSVNLICRGKQHCFLCLWLFVHTRSIILVLHLAVKWHLSKRETVHLLQYVKTCSGKKGYGVHVCQYTADLIDLLCCCRIACGANVHSQERIWICWLYRVKKKTTTHHCCFCFVLPEHLASQFEVIYGIAWILPWSEMLRKSNNLCMLSDIRALRPYCSNTSRMRDVLQRHMRSPLLKLWNNRRKVTHNITECKAVSFQYYLEFIIW